MKNIFINKKIWKTFSPEEMEDYIEEVYQYYRSNGFPYFPTDTYYRNNEIRKIRNYDHTKLICRKEHNILQSMHGLGYCWSFMPHSFSVQCGDKRTPMEVFNDDDLLKKVIRKRVSMGDNMSDNGLRKMLKIYTGTQSVSNFRPTAAGAIYSLFTKKGDTVWDMSSGYGGRLLGACLADVNYIGTEPCTDTYKMSKHLSEHFPNTIKLVKKGSEDFIPDKNSLDMCFTSPPYFDWEKYSYEPTQSFIKYPSKEEWLTGFMGNTLKNCFHGLKEGGILVINIADTPKYKGMVNDVKRLCVKMGFEECRHWNLALSNPNLRNKSQTYKYEPILVFKRMVQLT